MNTRSKIFWLIWLATVIAVIWFFAAQLSRGASPPLPGKKNATKSSAVQQGAGAFLLISKAIIPPAPRVWTNTIAWEYPSGWNLVSNFRVWRGPSSGDYSTSWLAGKTLSNKVSWAVNNPTFLSVTALGTNGLESEFSNEIRLPAYHKSNLVITVTCMNGGTNIACSPTLTGPWTKLNSTNWSITNPITPRYLRGIGSVSNLIKISEHSY